MVLHTPELLSLALLRSNKQIRIAGGSTNEHDKHTKLRY